MILLLLISILTLSYYYFTKNFDYWKKRNVLGPHPKLFVGNFPSIYNRRIHMSHEVSQLYKKYKERASVVGIFRGISPVLLVLDPAIIKHILITKFSHFVNPQLIISVSKESDPIVGRNPFMLKDEEWKESRSEIVPAFSAGRLKALWPIMQVVYGRMEKYINEQMKIDGALTHRELCAKYTTDVVASCLYGIESEAFTKSNSKIRALAQNVMSPSFRMTFLMMTSPLFPWLTKTFKVRFMAKKEADFMTELLRETMKYRKENKINRQDYMEHLLSLHEKKGLEEVDLVAHTAAFFFDGIETSSLVISNIFHELAMNTKVQNKLREELAKIKGFNGTFDYDAVIDLKYLDQVVYETLRLHPIVPTHSRVCTQDYEMKISSTQLLKIQRGIGVLIPVECLQVDPEYYENPKKFIPERFDEEKGGVKAYRDKVVLLPFGDGPRTCLGQKFGMAQVKSCVANTLDNYDISVDPKTPKILNHDPENFLLAWKEDVYLRFNLLKK